MTIKLGYLHAALFILFSCNKGEEIRTCENCSFTCLEMNEQDVITNDCIENWDCSFKIMTRSKVDVNEGEGIGEGEKNVFQMMNRTEGSIEIADDEFTNILVFELAESQKSFYVEDTEMEELNLQFRRLCYCEETNFKVINSGCMQGEQQSDGSWFLQARLEVPYTFGNIELKLEAQFEN